MFVAFFAHRDCQRDNHRWFRHLLNALAIKPNFLRMRVMNTLPLKRTITPAGDISLGLRIEYSTPSSRTVTRIDHTKEWRPS